MTKNRHARYLREIHFFIKNARVKFLIHHIPVKLEHGFCLRSENPKETTIIGLDPRKEFIPTLIHECIHGIYPKYKETKVRLLERAIIRLMKPKHYIALLKCFTDHAKYYRPKGSIKELLY